MDLLGAFLDEALIIVLILSGAPLLITAIAGLFFAVLQTAMQVQEQSVLFLIKLAVFIVVAFFGAEHFFLLLTAYLGDCLAAIASLGSLL